MEHEGETATSWRVSSVAEAAELVQWSFVLASHALVLNRGYILSIVQRSKMCGALPRQLAAVDHSTLSNSPRSLWANRTLHPPYAF